MTKPAEHTTDSAKPTLCRECERGNLCDFVQDALVSHYACRDLLDAYNAGLEGAAKRIDRVAEKYAYRAEQASRHGLGETPTAVF